MAWWRKQSAQTPAWNLEDYHTAFAATLKEQIEQGVAPWQQSWKPGARRLPEQLVSGNAYRGVNALHLSVAHTAKGYRDNRWATATQIQALGGQVRPGEPATPVLVDTVDDEQAPPPPGAPDTGQPAGGEQDPAQARPPMVRCDAVFNVEQADGLSADDRDKKSKSETHDLAERVIQESGIHVAHVHGDRAFYNRHTDKVTLPERDQFASADGYYQTALHELGHATGHPDRLNRATLTTGVGDFGSVEYAREELRAEIAAMLTGVRVGVGHDGSRGAPYVQGWLTALDDDPQEIDKAAAEAQHMSDYLLRQVRAHEQAIAQKHAALTDRQILRRPESTNQPRADGATAGPAPAPARGGRPRTPSGGSSPRGGSAAPPGAAIGRGCPGDEPRHAPPGPGPREPARGARRPRLDRARCGVDRPGLSPERRLYAVPVWGVLQHGCGSKTRRPLRPRAAREAARR